MFRNHAPSRHEQNDPLRNATPRARVARISSPRNAGWTLRWPGHVIHRTRAPGVRLPIQSAPHPRRAGPERAARPAYHPHGWHRSGARHQPSSRAPGTNADAPPPTVAGPPGPDDRHGDWFRRHWSGPVDGGGASSRSRSRRTPEPRGAARVAASTTGKRPLATTRRRKRKRRCCPETSPIPALPIMMPAANDNTIGPVRRTT